MYISGRKLKPHEITFRVELGPTPNWQILRVRKPLTIVHSPCSVTNCILLCVWHPKRLHFLPYPQAIEVKAWVFPCKGIIKSEIHFFFSDYSYNKCIKPSCKKWILISH